MSTTLFSARPADGHFAFDPPVFVPAAPARARRFGPFVVVVALVSYAAIVMAALTAPQATNTKVSARPVSSPAQVVLTPTSPGTSTDTAVG